jgi:hypothetical protein
MHTCFTAPVRLVILAIAALAVAAQPSRAEAPFPTRPIKIVVPVAAGGAPVAMTAPGVPRTSGATDNVELRAEHAGRLVRGRASASEESGHLAVARRGSRLTRSGL